MDYQNQRIVVTVLVAAGGIGLTGRIWAQAPQSSSSSSGSSSSTGDLNRAKVEVLRRWKIDGQNFQYSPNYSLLKAAEAVRNAKGDDEEAAARKTLTDVVETAFDEDMAKRKKDLAQLEERLTKLREQLDRRKAKKQDIVDLQIKVLLNEADGLGFTSGSSPAIDADLKFNGPIYVPGVPVVAPPAPPKPAAPGTIKVRSPQKTKPKSSDDSHEEST